MRKLPETIKAGRIVFERSTDGTYLLCEPKRDSFTWDELLELSIEIQTLEDEMVGETYQSVIHGIDDYFYGE